VLALVVALVLVRPGEPPPLTSPVPAGGPFRQLTATIRRPGTQLGFWAHFVCGTAPTVMALMWGYPFLTAALGLGISEAAGVFSLMVVGTVVAGPVIGYLMARFPLRRSNLVMTVVVGILLIWVGVILWPGEPPLWLVGVLFFAIGTGGPGSLIGFDIARTTNPSHALGSASGLVNVGGFLGGFVAVFGIGLVLDIGNAARVAAGTAPDLYALESFRIAFLVPVVVIAIGIVAMLIARRRARRWMFESEGIQIAPLWVALFRSRRASRRSAEGG
jgi:MFS family permease